MPLQQFLFFLRYFCFANFAFQENMTFLMFSSCLNTFYSILQSVHVLLCILLIIIIIFFLCLLSDSYICDAKSPVATGRYFYTVFIIIA